MTKEEILKEIGLVEIDAEIKPGDFYIAERNTGPKLLQCKEVKDNLIIPTCNAYPYNKWECVKVVEKRQG